jgi:hypothetical protein
MVKRKKMILELFTKFFKKGQNHGLHPSLRNKYSKSSLARCVLEAILKVQNFHTSSFCLNVERILRSKIRYAHGIHCPRS